MNKKKYTSSEYWDEVLWDKGVPRIYWTSNPLNNAYANLLMTGSLKYDNSIQWFGECYLSRFHKLPVAKGASIGCGTGIAERQAIEGGICKQMDGFDVSPASLDIARRRAQEAGLSHRLQYSLKNLNKGDLPHKNYEFMLSFGCLHHIENLEHLFSEAHSALKPDGLFYFNEYVGPSRFQWSEELLDIINKLTQLLPYRCLRTDHFKRMSEKDIADPSEAIRSDEIMKLAEEYFQILDVKYYGGTILFPLWGEVIWPEIFLDPSLEEYQCILKLLILLDESLTKNHEPSFVQVVACRKDAPSNVKREGHKISRSTPKHALGEWLNAAPLKSFYRQMKRKGLLSMALQISNVLYKTIFVLKNQGFRTLFWKFKGFLHERFYKIRNRSRS